MSTCEASSFSARVFSREEGVMAEEDAIVEAWVSVWAAPGALVMVLAWRGRRRGRGRGWGYGRAVRSLERGRVRMRCMDGWLR